MEESENKKKELSRQYNRKHMRFLIIFTILYIGVEYGYPLLKKVLCYIF